MGNVEVNEAKVTVNMSGKDLQQSPGGVPALMITCVCYLAYSVANGDFHFKILLKIYVLYNGLDPNQRCQVLFMFW